MAPKWDESQPHKQAEYFWELEYLFNNGGMVNTQWKEYAGHYVSYDMVETWLRLLEFTGHTYQE